MARSDVSMLEALVGEEKLTDAEHTAFADMHRKLKNGNIKMLSRSQHDWVERRYLALELDAGEPSENLVSSGAVPNRTSGVLLDYERQPRPLRPPGR